MGPIYYLSWTTNSGLSNAIKLSTCEWVEGRDANLYPILQLYKGSDP